MSDDAQSWMESLKDQTQVHFQPCDVSDWQQLEAIPLRSRKILGVLPDVWIPAAGIFEPVCLLHCEMVSCSN